MLVYGEVAGYKHVMFLLVFCYFKDTLQVFQFFRTDPIILSIWGGPAS